MAERLGWRFAKLWTASTTSALGSGLATIAAPLFVAAHTKSPLIVSATSAAGWLPWLLFALLGGVLVDRVDAAHTSSAPGEPAETSLASQPAARSQGPACESPWLAVAGEVGQRVDVLGLVDVARRGGEGGVGPDPDNDPVLLAGHALDLGQLGG